MDIGKRNKSNLIFQNVILGIYREFLLLRKTQPEIKM